MDMKWLEDFLSLASTRSFSRSAEARNVTQSAFSRRIRALEVWLGAPLVDRSTYPTTLTDEGRQFRETAEEVLRLLQDERTKLRSRRQHARSTIGIAALHTLSLAFYPKWLRQVEQGFGPIGTRLVADDFHACMQALVEGDCDFLLTFHHPQVPVLLDPARFPHIVIGQDRLVAVSGVDAVGAACFSLAGEEALVPYLGYGVESFLGKLNALALNEMGGRLDLAHVNETALAEGLKMMAIEGHGIAWLPESAILRELAGGLLVPLEGAPAIEMEIRLYRSLEKIRPIVERVWSYLAAAAHIPR